MPFGNRPFCARAHTHIWLETDNMTSIKITKEKAEKQQARQESQLKQHQKDEVTSLHLFEPFLPASRGDFEMFSQILCIQRGGGHQSFAFESLLVLLTLTC